MADANFSNIQTNDREFMSAQKLEFAHRHECLTQSLRWVTSSLVNYSSFQSRKITLRGILCVCFYIYINALLSEYVSVLCVVGTDDPGEGGERVGGFKGSRSLYARNHLKIVSFNVCSPKVRCGAWFRVDNFCWVKKLPT